MNTFSNNLKVAVIGQGVIGFSSALAIKQNFPSAKITLFSDRKFEDTCSFGPAGLFRLDNLADREWAKATFEWFAELEKKYSPEETALLDIQAKAYGDIVYNFHWLTDRERNSLFPNPSKHAIHYTAYASEGRRYVPWLRKQLSLLKGIQYQELDENKFDCIVNCAGLNGGKLAGDDDSVYPIRGVAFEVKAPCTNILTTRMSTASLSHWLILPARPTVRLEHCLMKSSEPGGKTCHVIHNYGHGGNGFTIGWGCSLNVVKLISEHVESCDAQCSLCVQEYDDSLLLCSSSFVRPKAQLATKVVRSQWSHPMECIFLQA
uniref:FAD dependent oxidoreductase domain-containing protein n=1 Tax=Ditylenchus dipsaci TaxID=166011 RepID=A0A915E340_9BILA